MNVFIRPTKSNIVYEEVRVSKSPDNSEVEPVKSKCSFWEKVKNGVNEFCAIMHPLVEIILPLCEGLSMFIRSVANLRKHSRKRGERRCVAW